MAKPPRRPRTIARSADVVSESVPGPALVARAHPGQPDLFVPAFIPPCKPVLRAKVPTGPLWQYEIKHDGYRIQAHVHRGEVRLFTKSGLDYADRLPEISRAVGALGRDAIVDGEAVMTGPDGVTDFYALHAALAAKGAPNAHLYAFDLLRLDGEDLRTRPLAERRAMLVELLIDADPAIFLSEHMSSDGEAMHAAACGMGLEGVVAKRIDRPYRSGPCEDWIKVKCTKLDHFAVIGFDPVGQKGVAALKLAKLDEGGQLRACGSVESGIGGDVSRALRIALDGGDPLIVEVEYRGWTPAGELRHPVFNGWERG